MTNLRIVLNTLKPLHFLPAEVQYQYKAIEKVETYFNLKVPAVGSLLIQIILSVYICCMTSFPKIRTLKDGAHICLLSLSSASSLESQSTDAHTPSRYTSFYMTW